MPRRKKTATVPFAHRIYAEVQDEILASGLTAKEQRFVRFFFAETSIAKAALAAGYSKLTAAKQSSLWLKPGSRFFREPLYRAIQRKRDAIAAAESLELHDLVSELKGVVFTDPLAFFETDGTIRNINDIPDAARKTIAEIEQTVESVKPIEMVNLDDGTITKAVRTVVKTKIKWRDKDSAIDKLMKVLGGYEADNRQRNTNYVVLATPVPRAQPGDGAKVINGPAGGGNPYLNGSTVDVRALNRAQMERSNEWVVANGLEDPINLDGDE